MKKFMKNCGILALVMILVGIVMTATAGIVKGPEVIAAFTSYSKTALEKLDSGVRFDVESDMDFASDVPMLNANEQNTFDATGITKLDMELGACQLNILPSEDQYFYAHTDGAGSCQVYTSDETLHVKVISATSIGASLSADDNEINLDIKAPTGAVYLYVPASYHFEEVKLVLGAGAISSSTLFTADDLEIELAAGEIELENIEVGKLNAEVGAGTLSFAGSVQQEADVECGMGEINLELAGSESDFNYDVEVAAGDVTIGRESFGGIAGERDINNGAAKNINVECAMGAIDISFLE